METNFGSLKNLCISQMFFSITFQGNTYNIVRVQSAHRKRGSSNKCEQLQYKEAELPVGQSSGRYPLYLGKIDVVKSSRPLGWNLRTSNYNFGLQLHGGLQPQRESALLLGQQTTCHLSHNFSGTVMGNKMLIMNFLFVLKIK